MASNQLDPNALDARARAARDHPMSNHLLLIDASGIAFRAFATSDPVHRASDGEPIGATLRFMEITWKMLGAAGADAPTHGAAVFDIPGPNFRHKLYPAYKSNRDPARRLILDGQMPYMKHAAETMGLFPIEAEGYEADDVIATLATEAIESGMRVTIVSSDKDFGQLVRDGLIEIVDPLFNRRVGEKEVVDKWGVPINRVTHVQALAGDSVDGYPGIRHCGPERAAGLIRAYGSINGVFRNVDKVPYPALKRALQEKTARERVAIFHRLATLCTEVPINPHIWTLTAMKPVLKSHLDAILKAIEAPAWAMQSIFHVDQTHVRLVPHDGNLAKLDALEWWRDQLSFPGGPLPEIPQCGWYKRVLIKNGPEVPGVIWAEPSPQPGMCFLKCEVNGKARDPFEEWPRLSMKPIRVVEYQQLVERQRQARFDPESPRHDPRQPIDVTKHPKSTNPRRARP